MSARLEAALRQRITILDELARVMSEVDGKAELTLSVFNNIVATRQCLLTDWPELPIAPRTPAIHALRRRAETLHQQVRELDGRLLVRARALCAALRRQGGRRHVSTCRSRFSASV